MTIALTGSSGFIGRVLAPLLTASGHELRVLVHRTAPGIQATVIRGDLLDADALDRLVSGVDVVIHLAAAIDIRDRVDPQTMAVNIDGTRLLLDAARKAGVRRFIHVSSVAAFEQAPLNEPLDETRHLSTDRRRPYDYAKAVAQASVLACTDLEVIVLAPTAVFGPFDDKPSLLGKAIIGMRLGRVPALFPGGVDFVDVRDVADAVASAVVRGVPGRVYLLAGRWAPLQTLNTGRRLPELPLWLIWAALPFVRAWAGLTGSAPYYTRQAVYNVVHSNRCIDATRAKTDLGFRPRPLEETLKDSIAWFQQQGMLSLPPAG